MPKNPEPKPKPGRKVLVIGMDLSVTDRTEYRSRVDVLIVTSGWIDQPREAFPKGIGAVWCHPDLQEAFNNRFPKVRQRLGDRNVRFSPILPELRRFIDARVPPLVQMEFRQPEKPELDPPAVSDPVDQNRVISSLRTQLARAQEQLTHAKGEAQRVFEETSEAQARLKAEVSKLTLEVLELRGKLETQTATVTSQTEKPRGTRTHSALDETLARLRADLDQSRESNKKLRTQAAEEKSRADRLQKELKEARAALVQERARRVDLVVLEASTSIERLQAEFGAQKASMAQLHEEIKEEKRKSKQLADENIRLQRELKEAQATYVAGFLSVWAQGKEKRSTAIERQAAVIAEAQEIIDRLESQLSALQEQLRAANRAQAQYAATVAKLQLELQQAEARALGYFRRLHERDVQSTLKNPQRRPRGGRYLK